MLARSLPSKGMLALMLPPGKPLAHRHATVRGHGNLCAFQYLWTLVDSDTNCGAEVYAGVSKDRASAQTQRN